MVGGDGVAIGSNVPNCACASGERITKTWAIRCSPFLRSGLVVFRQAIRRIERIYFTFKSNTIQSQYCTVEHFNANELRYFTRFVVVVKLFVAAFSRTTKCTQDTKHEHER